MTIQELKLSKAYIINTEKLQNMSNQTAINYWCYVCQAKITSFQQLTECSTCQQSAIQIIESDNSGNPPQNFQVYQIQNDPSPSNMPIGSTLSMTVLSPPPAGVNIQSIFNSNVNGVQISIVSGDFSLSDMQMSNPFMQQMSSLADFGGSMLSNLLNGLMRNESNLTPASPQQIQQLQRIQRVKECSICQQIDQSEESQAQEGYRLPCNHEFHKDCISPWLQKTNTCPCCRVVLP